MREHRPRLRRGDHHVEPVHGLDVPAQRTGQLGARNLGKCAQVCQDTLALCRGFGQQHGIATRGGGVDRLQDLLLGGRTETPDTAYRAGRARVAQLGDGADAKRSVQRPDAGDAQHRGELENAGRIAAPQALEQRAGAGVEYLLDGAGEARADPGDGRQLPGARELAEITGHGLDGAGGTIISPRAMRLLPIERQEPSGLAQRSRHDEPVTRRVVAGACAGCMEGNGQSRGYRRRSGLFDFSCPRRTWFAIPHRPR